MKGLEGISCEEYLRTLGLSGVKKRRLRGDGLIALEASWGGEVQRDMLSSSPWNPVAGHVGMVQSHTAGGVHGTLGSISLPRGS